MNSLAAGAAAGLVVDLSLYPIDTVKTRIQSKEGFMASGGFKNIYKGLSAVAAGSVPGGAAFFFGYDTVKTRLLRYFVAPGVTNTAEASSANEARRVFLSQAVAAMSGESLACCIRVPVEMVKQQMQVGHHSSILSALRHITNNASPVDGQSPSRVRLGGVHYLFRGMPIMLLRELPFSVIQMSLYEFLKTKVGYGKENSVYSSAALPLCGALSGGMAAFVTTPLDVIKTRIMLFKNRSGERASIRLVFNDLLHEERRPGDRFGYPQRFFRGASTRVLWISLGGSVFFGTYEFVKTMLSPTG